MLKLRVDRPLAVKLSCAYFLAYAVLAVAVEFSMVRSKTTAQTTGAAVGAVAIAIMAFGLWGGHRWAHLIALPLSFAMLVVVWPEVTGRIKRELFLPLPVRTAIAIGLLVCLSLPRTWLFFWRRRMPSDSEAPSPGV